jgi:High potential iron-sulfur protein
MDFFMACLNEETVMTKTRRTFLMSVAACGPASIALAQAPAKLDEKDPLAVAQGYVHDASKADTKKFPKYAKGQLCSNCALYQGKAADAWAGCPLFGAKQVAGKGWCNAWVKKA